MNLADIRKKAEENRRSTAVVSSEIAEESALLPEEDGDTASVFESPALNDFEMAGEAISETYRYDAFQEPERDSLEVDAPVYTVEHLPEQQSEHIPEPLPAAAVIAADRDVCQPEPSVALSPVKAQAGYNALAMIISGREAAADVDETAISQAHFAASEEIEEFLCFRVAHEGYAISIMAIKEIVKPRDVTEVPRMPAFILGVISLRGVIIPVMDMRLRLSLPLSPATGRERIIVLRMDAGFCGILVDEVIQVAKIKKSAVEEPPAVLDGIDRDFVTGLGHFDNRMLIILNLATILDIGVH